MQDLRQVQRNTEERRVRVTEVNPGKRSIIVRDFYGAEFGVNFDLQPSVVEIPQQGDIWVIKRQGYDWRLDRRLDVDTVAIPIEQLKPGDKKIEAQGDLHLGGQTIIINGIWFLSGEGDPDTYAPSGSIYVRDDAETPGKALWIRSLEAWYPIPAFTDTGTGIESEVTIGDRLIFGATGDVVLYRSAEGRLRTDNHLVAKSLTMNTLAPPVDGGIVFGDGSVQRASAGFLENVDTTLDVTVTATTSGGADELISASPINFDGIQHIIVRFYCPDFQIELGTTAILNIGIFDDEALVEVIGRIGSDGVDIHLTSGFRSSRILPTDAVHTYSVRAWKDGTGAIIVNPSNDNMALEITRA